MSRSRSHLQFRPDLRPRSTLLVALLALLASPLHADLWYQHYQRAERALADEDWAQAVAELNQALERRGEAGARVRTYGMRTTDYFPHFKLGIAYRGLGQLDLALEAFETEERLGAIRESEAAFGELQRLRRLVRQELEAEEAKERERVAALVADNLRSARERQAAGDLEAAIAAAGRALAVAPDDPDAVALMDGLRAAVRRSDEERQRRERIERWLARGRELLDAGSYAEASSLFRQALAAGGDEARIGELLTAAQEGLRAGLEQRDRRALIDEELTEARRLEAVGSLSAVLERLESVLAIEPAHNEALELQRRLQTARDQAEADAARRDQVAGQLETAAAEFAAGRFEAALSTANRTLALDPANEAALDLVARSYRRINQALLGGAHGNLPPAIRFSDLRERRDDGSMVQLVRAPEFRLDGIVIDNTPVEIAAELDGRPLEASITRQELGDFHLTQFRVDTRLAAGEATLRLTATDAESLSASGEYTVRYRPPFFRTLSFQLAAAAGLALVVGGVLVRRARRRARLRRRRTNPYVAGAPVLDEELFYGRRQLLDRVLQTVHNNSLLLYGERRIGKTSIQHQLKRRLLELDDPRYAFHPVYIDLQGTPETRFFATIAEEVFDELDPLLDGLEPVRSPDDDYGYRDLVRDLRAVIRTLERRTDKQVKLVLLIDEVDELNDYDPRINQRLRSLFMKSFADRLVAVVSGVEIKKHWEREGSPWYNFFEEIEVRALEEDEARDLIERPIRAFLEVDEGVVDGVLAASGRRPYLIQKLCIALVNRAYEQGRSRITVADLEAVGTPSET